LKGMRRLCSVLDDRYPPREDWVVDEARPTLDALDALDTERSSELRRRLKRHSLRVIAQCPIALDSGLPDGGTL
jgi:hypothetical protein